MGDSVRAIAILGVLACHASPAGIGKFWWADLAWNAQVGVDVFFALSGFLLYRPYLTARLAGRPQPSTRAFLRRRWLRILPAYWVALTVLALWPGLPGVFTGDWWRYYGLLQIYPTGSSAQGLGVAWTLCVEVSFYALLPVFASVIAALAPPRRRPGWVWRELTVLSMLAGAGLALRYGVWFHHFPSWVLGTLAGQIDYFTLGMALALLSVSVAASGKPRRWVAIIGRFPGVCLALALLTFLAMSRFAPKQDPTIPVLHLRLAPISFFHEEANHWLIALLCLLLLLPTIFGDQGRGLSRRVLRSRALVAIGVTSYGIYLWHAPLVGWIAPHVGTWRGLWIFGSPVPTLFILELAMSVPLAMFSYRWVESPFLRRRYRTGDSAPHAGPAQAVGLGEAE